MANCYNDCIHCYVCQYVNHDEYSSVQQLKDDCRYCHTSVDVVPQSEVEKLMSATDKVICEVKQEVAREIFAEIDDAVDNLRGAFLRQRISELKKKYIGKEND